MRALINRSASDGSTNYNKQLSAQTLHSELLSWQEQMPRFQHCSSNPENIDDLEMKKVVQRNFSDIATPMKLHKN